MIDSTVLENIIVGRVDPHIYAFSTETIPNYLKVGDTYRPLKTRFNEWRHFFPNLEPVFAQSSKINNELYFRDYSVHSYLQDEKHRERLLPDLAEGFYYSNEFFRDATKEDLVEAIDDIKKSAVAHDGRYRFYGNDLLPVTETYIRNQTFEPRKNQQDVINNFLAAVSAGRNNLLMYAVMRFGKSFTAMCCANSMPAHFVLIVSAKADVKKEWKKTIESHIKFENYTFMDKEYLDRNDGAVSKCLSQSKDVALFLTLQDLQGSEIKERHVDVFNREIDLLIIDETHYGARATEYGKVLKEAQVSSSLICNELSGYDESAESFDIETKSIKSKVRIHLSGTPYRILMGDEFEKEDIIAFCQFADIVNAQKEWDNEHFIASESSTEEHSEIKEWDNPYYGFPQMVRFAFNPSKNAKAKLDELKNSGIDYSFSALFRPLSLSKKPDNSHKYFKNEEEILEIFKAIDGSSPDDNILPFLNDSRIQKGEMCHHIVCVLPFRTSCDALEELLSSHTKDFINLNKYKILNVAGYESHYDDIDTLKHEITNSESSGIKTISLTVNKFLTGSTVEEWDTMLYFKDTSSPQEYDQAIFRLQNPYIKTLNNGDEIIKFNMKPQTLLVDFDPDRMFRLQELKSLFYNTNTAQRGNDELRRRVEKELTISPIIVINKGKMQEITPQNIIDAVRNYNSNRSILDEAVDLPFDNTLLEIDEIKDLISSLKPLKDRKGIELPPSAGDGEDLDIPVSQGGDHSSSTSAAASDTKQEDLKQKLAAYYMRILFYAFLTHDTVSTLAQVIKSINRNSDNLRISQHVGLDIDMLTLIYDNASEFKLSNLDCTIENVNTLGHDNSLSPIDRANVAMKKLSRISETEIVTPQNVANDLVSQINLEAFYPGCVVLDLASKQGELAYAIHKKYNEANSFQIYSVATSKLTYELTRKVYESLGIPVANVLNFSSFALLGDNSEKYLDILKSLKPNIILVSPPYNKPDGGGRSGSGSGSAIYHYFFNIAKDLSPDYISVFIKSNWYSGGRGEGLDDFRQSMLTDTHISCFHDYPDPKTYIDSDVALRGGVCTFLWEKNHDGMCDFYNHINDYIYYEKRFLQYKKEEIFIRYNRGIEILDKVLAYGKFETIEKEAFPRNPFKISDSNLCTRKQHGYFKVYLTKGKKKYINPSKIPNLDKKIHIINSWKVVVAKASPGKDRYPHAIISSPIISEPESLCTDSHLLVRIVENKQQAENLSTYMKTRFFRFMMLLSKNDQNMTREVFKYVPVVDFDIKWSDSELYELFGINDEEQHYIESLIDAPRE